MNADTRYSENRYQSADGLSLYYRSYGSSDKVLICLPGVTRNCKDFEALATRHAINWRVITPDLRGRGQSDWDPIPSHYQHLTYTRDIWKLVDGLGISGFTIVGTSLGGAIAMLMASQQPLRVDGVVLNDIGPVIPNEAISRLMKYIGRIPVLPDWDTAAARIRAAYELAFPNLPDNFWLAHTKLSMRETNDGSIIPDMDPAIGTTLRKSFRMMKLARFVSSFGMMKKTAELIKNGYWEQFRAMNMPILLLRGDLSDVLPLKLAKQMKQAHPTMRVTSVNDRGHAPFLDEPESMAALESFLERNRED